MRSTAMNLPVMVSPVGRFITLVMFMVFTAAYAAVTPVQIIGWVVLKALHSKKIDLDAVARVWVGYHVFASTVTADAVIKGVYYDSPVPGGTGNEIHVIDAVATMVAYATIVAILVPALSISVVMDMLMVLLCDNSFTYTEAVINNSLILKLKAMLAHSLSNI